MHEEETFKLHGDVKGYKEETQFVCFILRSKFEKLKQRSSAV